MKRYRFLFLLLAALSMTSCLDEHPKDQLDEDAIYGSASDIYINAVASLYNYIGGATRVRASRAPAVAFTIIIR